MHLDWIPFLPDFSFCPSLSFQTRCHGVWDRWLWCPWLGVLAPVCLIVKFQPELPFLPLENRCRRMLASGCGKGLSSEVNTEFVEGEHCDWITEEEGKWPVCDPASVSH